MDLPKKACWRGDDVTAILGNEALEGHEGIFLATHTPIKGLSVAGSHGGEIEGDTEQAVLDVLSDEGRRHAFCVVQGEPGSGKSHLIRWLSVNWPLSTDVKLLLQRADGSLDGALRQLRERLPEEFHELFDKMGRVQRATDQGRANLFLGNLANALDPDHFDPPLEDVDWCRENLPTEVVGHLSVRRDWKGPSRILRLMEGKGSGSDDERLSETASFNLFDIEDLAYCCTSIRGTGVRPAAETLATRLVKEAIAISEYRAKGWSADELERERLTELRASTQLMEALNLRRNDAIQNVLGISAQGLKDLFRQVRQALARRGQRLVLLLEDITSWEGVDDSLIDVLVLNAETRGADGQEDLCPLISMVGITPAYYDKYLSRGNYRGRITHELSLGEARTGELQDVATLRTSVDRRSFVARYLAAVRTGEQNLASWRERRRNELSLAPPNRCDDCPVQEGCHHTFGADDGIGLFPFTSNALENFYSALNDHDSGLTWKTPRGILQAVLNPNLVHPTALEDGRFPTQFVHSSAIVEDSGKLSARLDRMLGAKVEEQDDQDRMRRVLAFWGNRERADTVKMENGDVAFAGVPQGIFAAFRLPWIGESEATLETNVPPPTLPELPAPGDDTEPILGEDLDPPPEIPAEPGQQRGGGRGATSPRPGVREPPSRRRHPSRSELERLRTQLRAWADGGELESPSEWNKALHTMVCLVQPRRAGLDPYTFRRLLTAERVKIKGTGPAGRDYFNVGPEKWVREGFEAYVALRLDRDMSSGDAEFHRHNLGLMMQRLEGMVSDYADSRLSVSPSRRRWSPAIAIAQVLLARAWLRGAAFADDPIPNQLRALLSDESDSESDRAARCEPWRRFLERTDRSHDQFRVGLREMISLPQGTAKGFGLADLSSIAGAIQRLCTTLSFDPVPSEEVETGVVEFEKVREIIAASGGKLVPVVRSEHERLRQRAKELMPLLRERAILDHLRRVDGAIETVAKQMLNAAPDKVREWKTEYARIKASLEDGASQRVEVLLTSFEEGSESPPDSGAARLSWLTRAPARDLENVRTSAQLGEAVVSSLLDHVLPLVHESGHSTSLDDIHEVGRKLSAAIHRPSPNSVEDAA